MKRNGAGLTLLEVLIVAALMGILAAIAIPAYSGHRTKAEATGMIHDAKAVAADAAVMKTVYSVGVVPTQYATVSVDGTRSITATIGKISGGAAEAVGNANAQASLRLDAGNIQYAYKPVFE